MKRSTAVGSLLSALLITTLVVYGCGDDDATPTPTPTPTPRPDASSPAPDTGTPPGDPAPPTLGAQIDRFGRPAVNTAVNKTFTAPETRGPAQNAYNADNNASGWVAAYRTEIAANLAIYDGLDKNCGNQPFANRDAGTNIDRYGTLASVLADDRQWLNTASTTCTTYLAVELNATGALPNADCGRRKLAYDVIDATYNVVAGTFPAAAVTDGIAAVAAKVNGATFPYLAAP